MRKILLATHNPAKLQELKIGLDPLRKLGIELVTLNNLNIPEEPEETGKTFRENALLKAKFYSELTKLPTIADDGGIIIPYLNNEPGVKSRRWLGFDASDQQLINYTLKRLNGTSKDQRKAYLETCICFYYIDSRFRGNDKEVIIYEQAKIEGHIVEKPYKNYLHGFPYRALLIIDKFNKYYDELTPEEHAKINHRLLALQRLVSKIKILILK